MLRATVVLLLLVLAGCSESSPDTDSGGTSASDGSMTWGDGDYGVVLAHGAAFDAASWSEQAPVIADGGATVVAVEDISPEGILAAVKDLRADGIEKVALVGGSAGADAILDLASQQPDLPDQLILLSPNGTVEGLGPEPKLFIASEDESVAEVSTELADSAPGEDNVAEILPGSAHAQNMFDSDQAEKVLDLITTRIAEFA